MSILIRDMEMPPNCSECAFCGYYGNKTHLCDINQQEIDYEAMLENRRDDCPLVPVPLHGRLIDADALKEWIEDWFQMNRHYHPYAKSNNIPITELYDILERIPTIMPSDKDGAEC